MRLYTAEKNGIRRVCVEGCDGKLYAMDQFDLPYKDMNDLIENITPEQFAHLHLAAGYESRLGNKVGYTFDQVKVLAPIPVPRQDILCLGVNYMAHREEAKDVESFQNKDATIYFAKRVNECAGSGEKIPYYDFVTSLDYEAELGVIIGKDAKNVTKENALDYVFGYTIINDVTARNLQHKHKQWYIGKSLDGYTLMGPCIVTADEIGDVHNLEITCHVNGEERQHSNTGLMIQSIEAAIEEVTQGITLKKASIISTGTPGGVGFVMDPPGTLKRGDEVVCTVEKIGKLTNVVE